MNTLEKHEVFEIEVLSHLKSGRFLEPLVFGRGTMLRLCYELNRYSADLDFWFVKKIDVKGYFQDLKEYLKKGYEITDAAIKFHTLLFEIRTKGYPKRLKIEIRKKQKQCDFQERIAFSKYSTDQVILKAHTLEQAMKNKIEAALSRREIRDCFDIEFLLRRGVRLDIDKKKIKNLKSAIALFKNKDYSVTLGGLLEPKERAYYKNNKFSYLLSKLDSTG